MNINTEKNDLFYFFFNSYIYYIIISLNLKFYLNIYNIILLKNKKNRYNK